MYFDEVAATDSLILENKGLLITEVDGEKKLDASLKGNAKMKVGNRLIEVLSSILPVNASVEASGEVGASIEQFKKTQLRNALLFDYIDLVKKILLRKTPTVEIFENVEFKYIENTMAYIQSISPYMKMIAGTESIGDGMNIEYSKINETLKNGKGYYELIFEDNGEEKIIRINNLALWNNYKLSDLIGMKVQVIAIYSGEISK